MSPAHLADGLRVLLHFAPDLEVEVREDIGIYTTNVVVDPKAIGISMTIRLESLGWHWNELRQRWEFS